MDNSQPKVPLNVESRNSTQNVNTAPAVPKKAAKKVNHNTQKVFVLTNISPKKAFTKNFEDKLLANQNVSIESQTDVFGKQVKTEQSEEPLSLHKILTSATQEDRLFLLKKLSTHKNMVAVKNQKHSDIVDEILSEQEQQDDDKYKIQKTTYIELHAWWKTHKNSLKKELNDLVPINYEYKSSWEMITNSILAPSSAEGRQWWQEVANYKKG